MYPLANGRRGAANLASELSPGGRTGPGKNFPTRLAIANNDIIVASSRPQPLRTELGKKKDAFISVIFAPNLRPSFLLTMDPGHHDVTRKRANSDKPQSKHRRASVYEQQCCRRWQIRIWPGPFKNCLSGLVGRKSSTLVASGDRQLDLPKTRPLNSLPRGTVPSGFGSQIAFIEQLNMSRRI